MRTFSLMATLVAVLGLAGTLAAQCPVTAPPGIETFESLAQGGTGFGTGTLDPLPPGWSHDITPPVANVWHVDAGGTPSSATGPSIDHSTGTSTGKYLYTETSGSAVGDEARVEACFNAAALVSPNIEFWYHMFGITMGTLRVDQTMDGGVTWTPLFTATGDMGDVWLHSGLIPVTPDANAQVHLRFVGISGGTFRSDMAIDDVGIGDPFFQVNSADGAVDLDGLTGSAFQPVIVNKTATACGGDPGTFNVSAQSAASFYEVVISDANLIAPGLTLGTEIVNLDITSNLSYLNGGGGIVLTPMPGAAFPGAGNSSFSLGWSISVTTDIALQGAFTTPAAPGGFVLSQGNELHVAVGTPGPIPVSVSDDGSFLIDLTSPSSCLAPNGVTFNGAVYTQISVESNGRVMFGSSDGDFSPSVSEALTDAPFLGFWSDLSSQLGSVTVTTPSPDVIRVDYVNVPYFGSGGGSNTWGIQIDDPNQTFTIDGLTGVGVNNSASSSGDSQFLGISVGGVGSATDPGITAFAAPGTGTTVLATDMVYDFIDGALVLGTTTLLPSLVPGTLSGIDFLSFVGGFAWTAF